MNSTFENSKFVTISALVNSPDWRAVRQAVLFSDRRLWSDDFLQVYENFSQIKNSGLTGDEVPVGSVEFVKKWALYFGIKMPSPIDYPQELNRFYGRHIALQRLDECVGKFVKPLETKLFSARKMPVNPARFLDEVLKLRHVGVSLQTLVWSSKPVRFTSEFRAYVLNNNILGISQYDVWEDRRLNTSELGRIKTMVDAYAVAAPVAYAIDVGFNNACSLLVVEVNDAWATGYYPWGSMQPTPYTIWLASRWRQILEKSKNEGDS